MDVALVRRPLEAVAGLGEAGADPEDEVRLAHEDVKRPWHGPAARPERQRVILREGALALEARGHGRGEQLGQRPQLGPRLGVVDALTGVEDRALGGDEGVRGSLHVGRVRGGPDRDRRDVAGRIWAILVPDVPGNLDQDRSRPAVAQPGERAPHGRDDGLRQNQLVDPLGHVSIVQVGAEVGRRGHLAAIVAGGDDQDRHGIGVRLGHAPERVLGARPGLHREDADALAGGHPAHRVGHMEPGALLADDDRPDPGRRRGLDERADRVPDERVDALAPQDVRDRFADLHATSLRRPTVSVRQNASG